MGTEFKSPLVVACICVLFVSCCAGLQGGLNEPSVNFSKDFLEIFKKFEAHVKAYNPGVVASVVPVDYKYQVVRGTMYYTHAIINLYDGKQFDVHAKLWDDVTGPPQFMGMKAVDESTPLEYF